MMCNPKLVLDQTNNHFINIGKIMVNSIAQKLSKTVEQIEQQFIPRTRAHSTMFLLPVVEQEILEVINTLHNDSTPGLDGMDNKVLKGIKEYISKPLVHIFNLSFSSGNFPDLMKKICVRPLHKAGDKLDLNNYRPISLISNISKILEKLVKTCLVSYLDNNNILSSNQYGFRSGKNTEDAFYELSKFVSRNLDANKKCLGVFLDLAKAFDTVSHLILLKKH
jgi:hypothetical protein